MNYTTLTDTPQVYVDSLRDYNEGKAQGFWLDLSSYTEEEEVLGAIQDFLTGLDNLELQERMGEDPNLINTRPFQPREEWFITDYEGFPERLYSEHMEFTEVLAYLEEVQELDQSEREAYELYVNNSNYDTPTVERFRDAYRGNFGKYGNPMEVYAEELFSDIYDIPDHLINYIDWSLVARDLQIDGYWEEQGHVFTNE